MFLVKPKQFAIHAENLDNSPELLLNPPLQERYINYRFVLHDYMHDWFMENNIKYELVRTPEVNCKFEKAEEALLFKLAWC